VKKLFLTTAAIAAALVLAAQAAATPQAPFITDTVAPGGGTLAQGYRFITDTLAPGGGTVTATVESQGFSWSAAGVGALTAVGVVLLLAGTALTVVRRRTIVTT